MNDTGDGTDAADADADALRAQVIERDSWHAHSMFTSPSEVWSADFCNSDNNYSSNTSSTTMILSCGDEGKVKFWDVRCPTRPVVQVEPFGAGATCAAAHPRKPNIVAVGSYDETVCLYDVRYLQQQHSSKKASSSSNSSCLGQSETLGGGIWRIKWHPYSDDRLLVAAMHCGCRVLKIQALSGGGGGGGQDEEDILHQQHHDPFLHDTTTTTTSTSHSPAVSIKPIKKFTQHESMAYGADWLVCRHPMQNGYFEAAASCSFYDRSVFLWDSVVV
jgi:diphthamide biosynthesis protein 7